MKRGVADAEVEVRGRSVRAAGRTPSGTWPWGAARKGCPGRRRRRVSSWPPRRRAGPPPGPVDRGQARLPSAAGPAPAPGAGRRRPPAPEGPVEGDDAAGRDLALQVGDLVVVAHLPARRLPGDGDRDLPDRWTRRTVLPPWVITTSASAIRRCVSSKPRKAACGHGGVTVDVPVCTKTSCSGADVRQRGQQPVERPRPHAHRDEDASGEPRGAGGVAAAVNRAHPRTAPGGSRRAWCCAGPATRSPARAQTRAAMPAPGR